MYSLWQKSRKKGIKNLHSLRFETNQAKNVSLPRLPHAKDIFPHHVVVGYLPSECLGWRWSDCLEGHASRMGHSTRMDRLSQLFLERGYLWLGRKRYRIVCSFPVPWSNKPTSKLTLSTLLNPDFSIFCVILFRLLSSNQLTGTIPSSIGNLSQLQSLFVHSFFRFHQQRHIKTNSYNPNFYFFVWLFRQLYFNQLSGTIPSLIGNLSQLQYLYVHSFFQFHQ